MKLKVFDRLLLGILLIVAILFSFVLFGIASNLIPEDTVATVVSLFAGCGGMGKVSLGLPGDSTS